jgi:hypothetical protein
LGNHLFLFYHLKLDQEVANSISDGLDKGVACTTSGGFDDVIVSGIGNKF